MALLEDVSLKLLFLAENNAQDVLDTLVESMGNLLGVLRDFESANPFAAMTEDAATFNEAMDTTIETAQTMGDTLQATADRMTAAMQGTATETVANQQETSSEIVAANAAMAERVQQYWDQIATQGAQSMNEVATQATEAGIRIADAYGQVSSEIRGQMIAAAQEIAAISIEAGDSIDTALQGATQAAKDMAAELGIVPGQFDAMTAQVEQLNAALAQTADEAKAVQEATATAMETGSVAGGVGVGGASHGGMGSSLMMTGMNAMMGYYGMQMLGTAGMNFSSIEQMQKLNNQTPQEAAQMMALLGMGGMTGSSATSFLSGMAGQMQQTFTPQVGTGMLSQQAILLQSLGITQQDTAQSPAMLLNTIAQRYGALQSSGQGSKAAELLNLSGTSQMGAVFQNWALAQKQTSGLLPGMTSAQVSAGAKQGVSMESSMQKLALAFDQLAITLIPIIAPLVKAVSSLMTYFTSGSTELQRIVHVLEGVALAIVSINIAKALLGMFAKSVPYMTVRAAVVNLMGGTPGSAGAAASGAGAAEGEVAAGTAGAAGGSSLLDSLGITGLVTAGATALGKLRAAASLTWDGVAKLGSTLGDLASGALDTIIGAFSAIGGILATVGEVIGGIFLAAVEAVGLPIEVLVGALVAVGIGIYELITHWKQVTKFLVHLSTEFSWWVAQTSVAISHWVQQTITAFLTWSRRTLAAFATWSGQIWGAVAGALTAWTKSLTAWAGHLWKAVSGAFSQWTQDLVKWAGHLWKAVLSAFTQWTQDLVQWAQSLWHAVYPAFTHWTASLIQWAGGLWSATTGAFSQFVKNFQQWVTNLWNGFLTAIPPWLRKILGISGSAGATGVSATPTGQSGTSAHVSQWIQQAMKDTGVSGGSWGTMLTRLVMAESGGNPNAVSSTGVNYGGGHGTEYATGIAQMMPTTFQTYMQKGMQNILNPIDNLVASIRYISAQFGNPQNLMQKTGLGTGAYRGYASGGLLNEAVRGIGMTTGSQYLFGEAGPEFFMPAHGMASGGHGGNAPIFNISVAVDALSSNPQGMAQQVASELVQQVKRRGNFSWGVGR